MLVSIVLIPYTIVSVVPCASFLENIVVEVRKKQQLVFIVCTCVMPAVPGHAHLCLSLVLFLCTLFAHVLGSIYNHCIADHTVLAILW